MILAVRSRLYRSEFLQVNTSWKALAEIYTMHSFAPFSNLKIFVKNCWKFCCFFKQNFAKFVRNLLNFAKFLPIFFGIFPKCSIFLKIAGQFSEKFKNSKIWWNFHKFSQNSEIFRWKTVICRLHLDGLVGPRGRRRSGRPFAFRWGTFLPRMQSRTAHQVLQAYPSRFKFLSSFRFCFLEIVVITNRARIC